MHSPDQNILSEDTRYSSKWPNLADERLSTKVLYATDDFFAEKENLIKPGRGIFIPDKYTDRGKWMDGWESRRKRGPGHDYCIVKLGLTGKIFGIDIDTNHFLGNHPPHASVEACNSESTPNESTQWAEILPKSALKPGSQNLFDVAATQAFTHIKLNIYPDGGVARLRVYGEVHVDWNKKQKSELIDLAAIENGGQVLTCNDMFFSSKDNLIMPGRGVNMGDGWETKRRREPGHDWVILKLGHLGVVEKIEVDTAHFKGNYPDSCSVLGAKLSAFEPKADVEWKTLLDQKKLNSDSQHFFDKQLHNIGPINHVKLNIFPDGGISRIRIIGTLA